MTKRRDFFRVTLAATALTMVSGLAWAAPPTIEIIAMAHPPVQSALKPLREWLASQGSKVRVVELDAESPQGEKRLEAVGQRGHIPIAVVVQFPFVSMPHGDRPIGWGTYIRRSHRLFRGN
jgi:hypothetical protein